MTSSQASGIDNHAFMMLLVKYGLIFFGILAVVYVITLLTPHLAKWVDRRRAKRGILPPPSELIKPEDYQVRGMFDADRSKKPNPNITNGNEEKSDGEGNEKNGRSNHCDG